MHCVVQFTSHRITGNLLVGQHNPSLLLAVNIFNVWYVQWMANSFIRPKNTWVWWTLYWGGVLIILKWWWILFCRYSASEQPQHNWVFCTQICSAKQTSIKPQYQKLTKLILWERSQMDICQKPLSLFLNNSQQLSSCVSLMPSRNLRYWPMRRV